MILFLITIIFTLAGCSDISDDPVADKQRQLYALNKSIDHYPHTSIPAKKKAVFTRFKPIVIPDNVASALKDIKASKLVNKLIYTPKIGMINDIPVRTNAVIANAFIISSFL